MTKHFFFFQPVSIVTKHSYQPNINIWGISVPLWRLGSSAELLLWLALRKVILHQAGTSLLIFPSMSLVFSTPSEILRCLLPTQYLAIHFFSIVSPLVGADNSSPVVWTRGVEWLLTACLTFYTHYPLSHELLSRDHYPIVFVRELILIHCIQPTEIHFSCSDMLILWYVGCRSILPFRLEARAKHHNGPNDFFLIFGLHQM